MEQDDETAALRITSDSNSLWEYVGDTANYKFNLVTVFKTIFDFLIMKADSCIYIRKVSPATV